MCVTEAFDAPSVPEVVIRSKIESIKHKGCDAFGLTSMNYLVSESIK